MSSKRLLFQHDLSIRLLAVDISMVFFLKNNLSALLFLSPCQVFNIWTVKLHGHSKISAFCKLLAI